MRSALTAAMAKLPAKKARTKADREQLIQIAGTTKGTRSRALTIV
jgi:hypothetical protein